MLTHGHRLGEVERELALIEVPFLPLDEARVQGGKEGRDIRHVRARQIGRPIKVYPTRVLVDQRNTINLVLVRVGFQPGILVLNDQKGEF
jgi:hypothetical protein